MSVNKVVYIREDGNDLEELDVEGTTFSPKGDIKHNGKVVQNLVQTSSTINQMNQVAAPLQRCPAYV